MNVGVIDGVTVLVGVCVGVSLGVIDGVTVLVGVCVGVLVIVGVGVGEGHTIHDTQFANKSFS